jgi:hypothetical protein
MKAHAGDRLVVMSRHLDEMMEEGEILEVQGPDGDPPFLVRWEGGERESLVFPGPDARVVPHEQAPPRSE